MQNTEFILVSLLVISIQTTANCPVYLRNITEVENTGLGDALGADEKKAVIKNDFPVVNFSVSESAGECMVISLTAMGKNTEEECGWVVVMTVKNSFFIILNLICLAVV